VKKASPSTWRMARGQEWRLKRRSPIGGPLSHPRRSRRHTGMK
jgi:hypothetical protein